MTYNKISFTGSTVALIGSTKYKTRFMDLAKELELKGATVTHTHLFSHYDGYELTKEELEQAERNGESRINKADYVIVISPDGCIGENTMKEIRYAANSQKTIVFYPIKIGTHNGVFHADDVLSVALIKWYYFNKLQTYITGTDLKKYLDDYNVRFEFEVIRTRDTDKLNQCDWVVDVFNGNEDVIDEINKKYYFDHHPDDNKYSKFYPNGIKMAACGKVASYIFKDNPAKLKFLRENLLYAVEAQDNGQDISEFGKYYNPISFVHLMNPLWNERVLVFDTSEQTAFTKAVDMVYDVLVRILNSYEAAKEAEIQLDNYIDDAIKKGDGILYMCNYFNSWIGKVLTYNASVDDNHKIYAVVYPDIDTGFVVRNIPKSNGSFEAFGYFPESWRGLKGKELSKESGLDAIFCHVSGFMSKWKYKDDAFVAAEILVTASKNASMKKQEIPIQQ